MAAQRVAWARAVVGAFVAEIAQVAAAFGWVAIYSYFINPGQAIETYRAYAQVSGPWVSIIAGAPIFLAASYWIARSLPTARALFAVFLCVDLAILIVATDPATPIPWGLAVVSYTTKLAMCVLGGRLADRRRETIAASVASV
jgi:hypothetical protein